MSERPASDVEFFRQKIQDVFFSAREQDWRACAAGKILGAQQASVRAPSSKPHPRDPCKNWGDPTGFSYVEVLLATLLLAISLVPALDALKTGIVSSQVEESYLSEHFYVLSKMEEVLKDSVTTLDTAAVAAGSPSTPTSYSDPIGTPSRRLVYLSRYDGDNSDGDNNGFTGVDVGLIWIKVEIEGSAHPFETLASDY